MQGSDATAATTQATSGTVSIAVLLLCIALLALATGLQGSLIGVSAVRANFTSLEIGYVATGYPVGLLIGSWLTLSLVDRVGYIRVFAAYASIASSAALLVPLIADPNWWFALRVLTGVCTAGLYIICEAWLNAATSNANRGRVLAVYMVVTYSMMGLGQFLLAIDDTSGLTRFIVASVILSFALVPITLIRVEAPSVALAKPLSLATVVRASPLAAATMFVNGIAQSAFFGLGAVYGSALGLSVALISLMMALPTLGVTLLQYPLGQLSDLVDRRALLLVVSGLAALAALAASLALTDVWWLIALFALYGTLAIPTRSIALAHANDQIPREQTLSASSKLFLIYGIGSTAGPLAAGTVMEMAGTQAFMQFHAAAFASVLIFSLVRILLGPVRQRTRQAGVVQVTPTSTPVATKGLLSGRDQDDPEETPAAQ